jgi:hypothetical protein
MTTRKEIIAKVSAFRKLSERQIDRHMKSAGIFPAGARQRPQQYADDAGDRLLTYLGLIKPSNEAPGQIVQQASEALAKMFDCQALPLPAPAARHPDRPAGATKILTLAEIRAIVPRQNSPRKSTA